MNRTVVVALGGNAFTRRGQAGTYEEMAANTRTMAKAVRGLRQTGWRVVVTHGNGPQVGNLAIQQDAGAGQVPEQPLHALVAMTQGLLGSLISQALGGPDVVGIVTHVVVDPADPAFARPTKPVGPFYAEPREGLVEDAGRGYRRVVPSPPPLKIIEARAITRLLREGFVVVAAGGGGIPVDAQGGHVSAVIDKDLTAALLATAVGAHSLVLVTDVDMVMLDFGTLRARPITTITSDEMRRHLLDGQFPEGSMGPKVRAALQFLDAGGGCAAITRAELVPGVLSSRNARATRIVGHLTGRGAA
ncbi:carbamate kinase [Streptosporangium sp. NPDC000396]|uniref:amino acid kinase family protein n=1 Tax=Streptosporangium sp. NPDC000396 TaxID=3366185 RepID=UPI0036BE0777